MSEVRDGHPVCVLHAEHGDASPNCDILQGF